MKEQINLNFEEAIKRLEDIVKKLESDSLSLDESLKLFKEGIELSDYCNKKLDEAERQINIILKGQNGEVTEEEFKLEEE
ncbi:MULTISPECIES: exodeoxyribonuclease VII small subunit [Caloramator]|jgi:exodeoxyribonuclease VII small subunit|uniref:Exodeoxyribonuclease 7 small subunit n=1 Tax=Caloramator australicus RC3 TaxID=857293 RepID=I7KWL7_9CLOT|nr:MULTISPECIES: exodeoxyribonuclease VII small subunit [Caloramator]MDO6354528.1 exodeoxyribonuclease VII small subunit [Caloramator sp. CAR-1]CCJ34586.1 exodeoxyribonuclease VII, small subunit [Caloramator australicus RC3]